MEKSNKEFFAYSTTINKSNHNYKSSLYKNLNNYMRSNNIDCITAYMNDINKAETYNFISTLYNEGCEMLLDNPDPYVDIFILVNPDKHIKCYYVSVCVNDLYMLDINLRNNILNYLLLK